MPIDDETPVAERAAALFRDEAPSLAPWRTLGPRIARIIKDTPPLAGKLLCAPRHAFHAVAFYMQHHEGKTDYDIADFILHHHPKDLLAECISPAPTLFPFLKKCGTSVHAHDFYVELNELLLAGMASEFVHDEELTDQAINFMRLTRHLDPLVIPARWALRNDTMNAEVFHHMLVYCRSLGVISNDESEARILRLTKPNAISRYVAKRLERCVSPIDLNLAPPLYQVKFGYELSHIARTYSNCLRRPMYAAQLGMGTHVYAVLDDTTPAVVELMHETGNTWSIVDAEHPESKKASLVVRERIAALMTASGLNVRVKSFEELWEGVEHMGMEGMPHINHLWDQTWNARMSANAEPI